MSDGINRIDGKALALQIRKEIKTEVAKRTAEGRHPGLAVIIVGEDPASQTYVRTKRKVSEKLGMVSKVEVLPADTDQATLLAKVHEINNDDRYHGLLVQSPLPKGLDEEEIVRAIDPMKDVDGFHPYNIGLLALNQPRFVACTPYGIMHMLERSGVDPSGKDVVVLGRSHIVGMPMSLLLMRKAKGANATVTICHSRTQNLAEVCSRADILIAAIGSPNFVTADMVKDGAVVIDVGINRIDADNEKGYKIVGDVDFDAVAPKTSMITPVPGGVGPMTIAMLMLSTLKAEELQFEAKKK